ncbi:MAG: sugar phosphate isomerase/epimerase [Kiritimatiellae bacterium]|nr:sugar phosphate isomerase/epimerase [Kiritimatiellia bacterium]
MKTGMTRRGFFEILGASAAAAAFSGCCSCKCGCGGVNAKMALQLYSIKDYIKNGVGLDRALENVAAIGYKGVEFAGYYQYANDPKGLRKALANAGVKAVGTHVSCAEYGLDTKQWIYNPEQLKKTCEFNMSFGNNLVICPGGGNFPPGCSWSTGRGGEPCTPSQAIDDHTKKLAEYYNKMAADAAKMGCRIGLHNHTWEHAVHLLDGTSFWDYFFSNTDPSVCMEQDVGWTTCAGVDPKEQYVKYPHRAPTLHAKENGMGKNVKEFDAILGQPGKPGATPVDWDGLIPVTEKDGVAWYVVECERHFDDLSAITPSYAFLKTKGIG